MSQAYRFIDENGEVRLFAEISPDPVPAAGSLVPVANATGVTVDSTTYADTIAGGGAKLTTLVFPADQGAIAIAISGDSFPRYVIASDPHNDGIYMGNGTYNPVSDGIELFLAGTGDLKLLPLAGGSVVLGANASVLPTGEIDCGAIISTGKVYATSVLVTAANAAPADNTLNAGEAALWLDATNGAGKLMVKAKTANGTVVAGSVTLA